MIDIGRIQRPTQRTIHYVVAFRTVLPAHVLHDPNVAALDDHFERIVIAVQNRPEMCTGRVSGELRRVVGGPRQEDWRTLRTLRHDDDRMQAYAIAYRNHQVASRVFQP